MTDHASADPAISPGSSVSPALCLSSPDCIKVLDEQGRVQFFNPEGLALMEIAALADVRDAYWPDLWPGDARQLAVGALAGARRSGVASFRAECPTAMGTRRYWDVTVMTHPERDRDYIVVSRDITAEHDRQQAQERAHERLSAIADSSADVLWDIDLVAGTVWWSEGLGARFGYAPDAIGHDPDWRVQCIHPDDRDRVMAGMARAVADGSGGWEDEYRFRAADGRHAAIFDRGAIIRDAVGTATRFVGVMQDVTARNALIEMQTVLAGEMSHRVNNLLAVMGGLFQQSIAGTADRAGLIAGFSGRLKAMASANTAVLRGSGKGAALRDIVDTHLAPYIGSGRVTVHGDAVFLPDTQAQPVALALNELATNALKYGALSVDGGCVALDWTAEDGDVEIRWSESGGPAVTPPTRTGFGSKLIERGISGATVQRSFDPAGFRCSIRIPVAAKAGGAG